MCLHPPESCYKQSSTRTRSTSSRFSELSRIRDHATTTGPKPSEQPSKRPRYIFIISRVAGEQRFVWTMVRRLWALDSLTQSDRHANGAKIRTDFILSLVYFTRAREAVSKSWEPHSTKLPNSLSLILNPILKQISTSQDSPRPTVPAI